MKPATFFIQTPHRALSLKDLLEDPVQGRGLETQLVPNLLKFFLIRLLSSLENPQLPPGRLQLLLGNLHLILDHPQLVSSSPQLILGLVLLFLSSHFRHHGMLQVGYMHRYILAQMLHLSSQISSLQGQGGDLGFIRFYHPSRPLRKTSPFRQALHIGSHLPEQDKGKGKSKSKIRQENKGVRTYGGLSLKRQGQNILNRHGICPPEIIIPHNE